VTTQRKTNHRHRRPYEQAIHHAIGHTRFDYIYEPFAGVARASRFLLDREQARYAYLNDTEKWPLALFGYTVTDFAGETVSPRITDDSIDGELNFGKDYADKITVSQEDWRTFWARHSDTRDPYTKALWVFDPPYDDADLLKQVHNHASCTPNAIMFAPRIFTPEDEYWSERGYRYDFTGPRQEETLLLF
jgi:hypothetical protein